MKKTLAPIILTLGLSACANNVQYTPTQAQNQVSALMAKKTEWRSAVDACYQKLEANPVSQLVSTEVLFDGVNSPNKMTLMTSNLKLSEKQKKAFLEFLALNQKCRSIDAQFQGYFPEVVALKNSYYADVDVVYARLVSREITIGQANREKEALRAKSQADAVAIEKRNVNELEAQHYQEVQARSAQDAQRRAIAAQYLMNQQNINAQQQMNNRSVNTTCNRFGNQVNCTSQ